MALWLYGSLASWSHSFMATWLHGYMATWLHGYMATWLHGYMATWLHDFTCEAKAKIGWKGTTIAITFPGVTSLRPQAPPKVPSPIPVPFATSPRENPPFRSWWLPGRRLQMAIGLSIPVVCLLGPRHGAMLA
ncbi:hypothetical protein HYFRA_00005311 [Hymenoscyphus fraxineus]|uniref:Uncharacterized protein n=1 Tax=Hymenoscyphus fraxineus TaxID=746836 RepID=A0A9N9Q1Z4_9HELO|nr:hypothetical protein HYFRA_00005311 [Hymenoscyphus fraxineus]